MCATFVMICLTFGPEDADVYPPCHGGTLYQRPPKDSASMIDEYRHTAMADDFLGLAALQQQTEATPTM
mgnify:CR=1 FL=1